MNLLIYFLTPPTTLGAFPIPEPIYDLPEIVVTNIPWAIVAAQKRLESGDGHDARLGLNVFAVKCWTCDGVNIKDDDADDKFKTYDSLAQAHADHRRILLSKRYRPLHGDPVPWTQAKPSIYKDGAKEKWERALRNWDVPYLRWAWGLDALGYATDPGYAEKLIKIIENEM